MGGAERCGKDGLGGGAPLAETGWGRALRLGQTWVVTAWEIAHLGSYYLGNTLGKLPFGKNPLGKYLTFHGTVVVISIDIIPF